MKVVFSERAQRDIGEIYDHISQKSTKSAQSVEDAIRNLCEGVGRFPFASSKTDEPNIRRIPLVRYPYTVFFRVDAVQAIVEIARVVYSGRVKSLNRVPD